MYTLLRRPEKFAHLSFEDRQVLEELARPAVTLEPREDLVQEGDAFGYLHLILDGWACGYRLLGDGRRQIISFLLPGDLCEPQVVDLRRIDHSIGTLTRVTAARLSHETFRSLERRAPGLFRAFWLDMLVASAIQREWAVSLGRRTALERLAHLFCEMFTRLQAIGMTDGSACDLPITQADLGDALGLSTVHVNRTLQELRATASIALKGKRFTIQDFEALKRLAKFNPAYLRFESELAHAET